MNVDFDRAAYLEQLAWHVEALAPRPNDGPAHWLAEAVYQGVMALYLAACAAVDASGFVRAVLHVLGSAKHAEGCRAVAS